jgi:phospholipid N-methyltransferase
MLDHLDLERGPVLEFGAGTGRLTESIVARLGPNAQLYCFESSPIFARHLNRTVADDGRVEIICDCAQNAPYHLRARSIASASAIVCSIPLSGRRCDDVLAAIDDCLVVGGRFIQVALVSREAFADRFRHIVARYVALNVPPERLHVCEKGGAETRREAGLKRVPRVSLVLDGSARHRDSASVDGT